jgi:hypothetical protein
MQPQPDACIVAGADVGQGQCCILQHIWVLAAAEELRQGLHSACSPLIDASITSVADVGHGPCCMSQHTCVLLLAAAVDELRQRLDRAGACSPALDVRAVGGTEARQSYQRASLSRGVASVADEPHERVHRSASWGRVTQRAVASCRSPRCLASPRVGRSCRPPRGAVFSCEAAFATIWGPAAAAAAEPASASLQRTGPLPRPAPAREAPVQRLQLLRRRRARCGRCCWCSKRRSSNCSDATAATQQGRERAVQLLLERVQAAARAAASQFQDGNDSVMPRASAPGGGGA